MRYIFALVVIKNNMVYAKPYISNEEDMDKAKLDAEKLNKENFPDAEFYMEVIGVLYG